MTEGYENRELTKEEIAEFEKSIKNDDFNGFTQVRNKYKFGVNSFYPKNIDSIPTYICDGPPIIFVVAYYGSFNIFKKLLEEGASLEPKEGSFTKPLFHYALTGMDPRIIETVVRLEIDLSDSLSPALKNGFVDLASQIYDFFSSFYKLDSPIDVFKKAMFKSDNPVRLAIHSGNVETLKFVTSKLDACYDNPYNYMNPDKSETSFHCATQKMNDKTGHKEILEFLYERIPNSLTKLNSKGNTALEYSFIDWNEKNPSSTILIQLMERIEDEELKIGLFNHADKNGMTALHYAAQTGNYEVCQMLLNLDFVAKSPINNKGQTPLSLAVGGRFENILDIFLETAVRMSGDHEEQIAIIGLNQPDNIGRTPLHCACRVDFYSGFERIINFDRNLLNVYDESGMSPLMCVIVNHSEFIFQSVINDQFFQKMISKDRNTLTGMSALHYAASLGYFNFVRTIIENNIINIKVKSGLGFMPIDYAKKNAHYDIVVYLENNTPPS